MCAKSCLLCAFVPQCPSAFCRDYGFSKGLDDWFAKHNRYSTDEASALADGAARTDWRGLFSVRDPVRRRRAIKRLATGCPCRPTLRFLYMYFWRMGFLDGRAGLTYCRLLAMYERMIAFKVREQRLRPRPQEQESWEQWSSGADGEVISGGEGTEVKGTEALRH